MSSISGLSLNSLFTTLSFSLTPHIHLTIFISARCSTISFSFLTGQVSLPCSILLHTQLLYSFPLPIKDVSLLVPATSINSIQLEFWPSQLHQHLHRHSPCHPNSRTYPLPPTLHWQQYPHLCVCVYPVPITGCEQLHHFIHATLYTTALPVCTQF